MKNISLILFFTSLFVLNIPANAQSENTFFVGSEAIENMDATWIEVQLGVRGWKQENPMYIFYGQDCIPSLDVIGLISSKQREYRACVALTDEHGDLIMFKHHLDGIQFWDELGFDLIEVVPHPERTSLLHASYIFKRRK